MRTAGVANFFLIDQSLCRPGGHHTDYARWIADAADRAGYLVTLGANRRLKRDFALESPCEIRACFRNTIYQPYSFLAGLRHLTRSRFHPDLDAPVSQSGGPRNRGRILRRDLGRDRRVQQFASDCRQFFQNSVMGPGDQALFAAVSEIELLGLARFLAGQRRTLPVEWHLQFHFNLFHGRPPEYAGQQETLHRVKRCFAEARKLAPHHRLHFYTTSQTLADQFNLLQMGTFRELPYPIAPDFYPAAEPATSDGATEAQRRQHAIQGSTPPVSFPIRLTSPGELRREKGTADYVQPLVRRLGPTLLADGRLELVFQKPRPRWNRRDKLPLSSFSDSELKGIRLEPHPLPDTAYRNLIRNTDAGLLFYDSRVYFSRRAGVLGELLSSGKPVIVPAGSWLADQIQPLIETHARNTLAEGNRLRTLSLPELQWTSHNAPLPGQVLSCDHGPHSFQATFDTATGETYCAIEFEWHYPGEHGTYCRIDCLSASSAHPTHSQTVGRPRAGRCTCILFPLPAEPNPITLQFRNAFHRSNLQLKDLRVHLLSGATPRVPVGAVGVIASDQECLAPAVDELVTHFSHYRDSANRFAHQWFAAHRPERAIEVLQAVAARSYPVAQTA